MCELKIGDSVEFFRPRKKQHGTDHRRPYWAGSGTDEGLAPGGVAKADGGSEAPFFWVRDAVGSRLRVSRHHIRKSTEVVDLPEDRRSLLVRAKTTGEGADVEDEKKEEEAAKGQKEQAGAVPGNHQDEPSQSQLPKAAARPTEV